MPQSKFENLYKEYGEAVAGLEGVLAQPKNEFMRDSAIKRFEIAFDLAWKIIKAHVEEKGIICASPVACFKEAYRQGILNYDDIWVKELVETRNKTVHTYDEKLAEEVYDVLPRFLQAFQELLNALTKKE